MRPEEYLTPSVAQSIVQIASDAGRAIMEIYEQPEAWNVQIKSDDSPLTQADLRANSLILDSLTRLTPEIPVLSEESPWTGGNTATYWAVDPLDGTKEFLKRNGEFTVNIALVIDGLVQMGVICSPVSRNLWLGANGMGSWAITPTRRHDAVLLNEHFDWSRMSLVRSPRGNGCDGPSQPIRLVESRSHNDPNYPDWLGQLISNAHVSFIGSSLKFCYVAQGDADCYVRMGRTSYWDTAAGHAILMYAGGCVLNAVTRESLSYKNPTEPTNPSFLAYGEVFHNLIEQKS